MPQGRHEGDEGVEGVEGDLRAREGDAVAREGDHEMDGVCMKCQVRGGGGALCGGRIHELFNSY